jgi:glycosyltransferase involved in cell wall biosynthesis
VKILLSAYACEPNRGSEPGVGWHWAIELSRLGHTVWVVTRANNRTGIEAELASNPQPNLHFLYYDLPKWARWWKKGGRGVHLYYLLWQWGAYRKARLLIQQVTFDWAHHITFGVFRHPSFMAFLGIPFIFGPLGGGERAPYRLRKSFPFKGYIIDFLRDMINLFVTLDPITRAVYKRSALILCKTKETLKCIPKKYRYKCRICLEIGVDNIYERSMIEDTNRGTINGDDFFRVLFVGRLIYWKGVHLALKAFSQLYEAVPGAQITVIGSGSDETWLHDIAHGMNIIDKIEWIPWMKQKDVIKAYGEYDVLIFPSLHDSSGNVVLEAMAQGLPVVCLDLGGPAVLVDDTCGVVVKTFGSHEAAVVESLAQALIRFAENHELRRRCSAGASAHAAQFQWCHVVHNVYNNLQNSLEDRHSDDRQCELTSL